MAGIEAAVAPVPGLIGPDTEDNLQRLFLELACASSRYFVGTGTFNDKLFGGAWHVGHGVICQVQGLGLNG